MQISDPEREVISFSFLDLLSDPQRLVPGVGKANEVRKHVCLVSAPGASPFVDSVPDKYLGDCRQDRGRTGLRPEAASEAAPSESELLCGAAGP